MTQEFIAALIGWAALLSGYDRPAHPIEVEFVPHSYFVSEMCGGKECNVIGGYFDAKAPNTIYIDEKFSDDRSLYAASFVVHELIHASQWYSGRFDSNNCEHSLAREREAYHLQNRFLIANGHPPILHLSHGRCAK